MSVVIEQHATKLHTEAEASQDLLQHEAVVGIRALPNNCNRCSHSLDYLQKRYGS